MPDTDIIAPQFASSDFDRTAEFYGQFGFHEAVRYPQGYLILRRDDLEIHFNLWRDPIDPKLNFNSAYMRFADPSQIDPAWARCGLPTTDCPRYVAPERKPWGMLEAHLVDPDGNLLFLGAEVVNGQAQ